MLSYDDNNDDHDNNNKHMSSLYSPLENDGERWGTTSPPPHIVHYIQIVWNHVIPTPYNQYIQHITLPTFLEQWDTVQHGGERHSNNLATNILSIVDRCLKYGRWMVCPTSFL